MNVTPSSSILFNLGSVYFSQKSCETCLTMTIFFWWKESPNLRHHTNCVFFLFYCGLRKIISFEKLKPEKIFRLSNTFKCWWSCKSRWWLCCIWEILWWILGIVHQSKADGYAFFLHNRFKGLPVWNERLSEGFKTKNSKKPLRLFNDLILTSSFRGCWYGTLESSGTFHNLIVTQVPFKH